MYRPCGCRFPAKRGETIAVAKFVGIATSRDTQDPVSMAVDHVSTAQNWESALDAHRQAWAREWERCDIQIEGDEEAQLAIRFNLFQLLIAAPRHDNHVNIGAKTLSGFGYRGHSFWDTEIFMLPLFIYTAPEVARNLLDYRYERLPGARQKAQANGFRWRAVSVGKCRHRGRGHTYLGTSLRRTHQTNPHLDGGYRDPYLG